MNLELLPEGHPQLKEISEPWDFEKDGDPSELIDSLIEVMRKKNAIGIAAPQCGIMKTIFIIYDGENFIECVNPKADITGDTVTDVEGCLSFPDLFMKVQRHESCIAEYQTRDNQTVQTCFSGLSARVYLHEFDHLLGITFDERVGQLSFKLAREKRKKTLKKQSRSKGVSC